ncbi:MAG TPA: hypothetical protein VD789_00360, partial [Thermomicrobiales bacterium]|nr:hypothetical protein [Thermomicrobiales bacterium]
MENRHASHHLNLLLRERETIESETYDPAPPGTQSVLAGAMPERSTVPPVVRGRSAEMGHTKAID